VGAEEEGGEDMGMTEVRAGAALVGQ
jgi:hypothetical protein